MTEISHRIAKLFSDGRERTIRDVHLGISAETRRAKDEASYQISRMVRMKLLSREECHRIAVYRKAD